MRESTETAGSGLVHEILTGAHPDLAPTHDADVLTADEQIRLRAFELYRERGGSFGDAVSDWLRAEREYLERRAAASEISPPDPRALD